MGNRKGRRHAVIVLSSQAGRANGSTAVHSSVAAVVVIAAMGAQRDRSGQASVDLAIIVVIAAMGAQRDRSGNASVSLAAIGVIAVFIPAMDPGCHRKAAQQPRETCQRFLI
jgi:hypothetical protein